MGFDVIRKLFHFKSQHFVVFFPRLSDKIIHASLFPAIMKVAACIVILALLIVSVTSIGPIHLEKSE